MKSFYEYVAESQKSHKYRLKTLLVVDDHFMDRLETALAKYDLVDVSRPKKTILQNYPLDFVGITSAEIYIIEFTTRIPTTSQALLQELTSLFHCPEKYIVVRGQNEPVERNSTRIAKQMEDGPTESTSMLNDSDFSEVEDASPEAEYGDAYNKKLLAYLAKVAAERDSKPELPEENKASVFNWLKAQNIGDDFNKDHDTVKPVHRKKADKKAVDPTRVGLEKNQGE